MKKFILPFLATCCFIFPKKKKKVELDFKNYDKEKQTMSTADRILFKITEYNLIFTAFLVVPVLDWYFRTNLRLGRLHVYVTFNFLTSKIGDDLWRLFIAIKGISPPPLKLLVIMLIFVWYILIEIGLRDLYYSDVYQEILELRAQEIKKIQKAIADFFIKLKNSIFSRFK